MNAARYRTLLLALVQSACLLGWPAAQAFTEKESQDPIAAGAEQALWWGDIDTLEALYEQAKRNPAENTWNGRTAVRSFRAGVAAAQRYGRLDGTYFAELERLTARWAAEKPESALRQLLHARALYGRAWHVRGGGYWNTVPQPARAEFVRLIAQAEAVIAQRPAVLKQDTSAHLYLILIGRAASWPIEQTLAIAEDGIARNPADTLYLLEEVVVSLLPKWGGSLEAAARAIDTYTARLPPAQRDEIYAQLWSEVVSGVDGNAFRQAPADWPRIKAGFTSLAGRLQRPYFRNRLAYLACLAQDRPATTAAMANIDEPDLPGWEGGGAGRRQNFEACRLWLRSTP